MAKKKSGRKWRVILTIDLGDRGGKRTFSSLEGVRDWLQTERTWWTWLQDYAAASTREDQARGLWNLIGKQFTAIDSSLGSAQADPNDTRVAAVGSAIQNAYTSARLIHSSSGMAKVVLAQCEIDLAAGVAATAYYMGFRLDFSSSTAFRGTMSAALAELGLKGTAESARKVLDELIADAQNQLAEYKTEQDELLTASRGFNKEIENQIASHDQEHVALILAHNRDFSDLVMKSKKQLEEISNTYDVRLALQAPVAYWKKKRNGHRTMAIWFATAFALGMVAAIFLLIPYLSELLTIEGGSSDATGKSVPLSRIGVALVLVTLVLWGLSILARIFLSTIHLANDAGERAVLIHTYLALMRRGKVLKEEEMKLILPVIFRPALAGIVKDDARPPSIAEHLTGKLKF